MFFNEMLNNIFIFLSYVITSCLYFAEQRYKWTQYEIKI